MRGWFRRRRPRIWSGIGQTLLGRPETVDRLKDEMLAGRYRYDDVEGQLSGWRDKKGDYYICEGHHRIIAALEIYWRTNDWSYVDRLLRSGHWDNSAPPKRQRLPTRSLWTRLLHHLRP